MEKKNEKIIIYVVGLLLITIMIVIFYIQKGNENFRKIKIDKNKHIVYSKIEKTDNDYMKYVPYINIKFDIVKSINNEIDNFVKNYLNNKKTIITYEYNVSGIYLSVLLKIEDYNNKYGPIVFFKSYNINLNNQQLLSDIDILSYFNINEKDVSRIIESDFKNYYQDLIEEGYIDPNQCNYSCFLRNRNVSDYLYNINYYIDKGDLIAYKPFILNSSLDDGEFFNPSNYGFMLVESVNK